MDTAKKLSIFITVCTLVSVLCFFYALKSLQLDKPILESRSIIRQTIKITDIFQYLGQAIDKVDGLIGLEKK